MFDSYVIGVGKDNRELGCIRYIKSEIKDLYAFLEKIKDIIKNYNQNLVSKDIPDLVLAHRFLGGQNAELTQLIYSTDMCEKTFSYVTENYSEYNWLEINPFFETCGKIALVPDEIDELWIESYYKAYINLDTNTIVFQNVIKTTTQNEYSKLKGISVSEVEKTLPIVDLDPQRIAFNEFDELEELLKKDTPFIAKGEYVYSLTGKI